MRTLAARFIAALLLAVLVSIGLVSIFARTVTLREFDRYVQAQALADFTDYVRDYYATFGTWEGLGNALRIDPPPRPEGAPPARAEEPPPSFLLIDPGGMALTRGGEFFPGDRIPPDLIAKAEPLIVDDATVARVLDLGAPEAAASADAAARDFIRRVDATLIYATAAAVLIAGIIGVVLARFLTRTLRDLGAAIHSMRGGELAQQVPVRSRDELGELARAFNAMSAELARAHNLRRQVTAEIAHDLRTPLTVLTGYIEALRDGVLPPDTERFAVMHGEAVQLMRLVEDLHTLSLADAGELALNRIDMAVDELLTSVQKAHALAANERGVDVTVAAGDDLPLLHADRERLAQVLGNLVRNALRYTPAGGRITLRATGGTDSVRLSVSDTGSGIAPEKLPYIFERFYRADSQREGDGGESGLGLAIARSLVEAHGGRIQAESAIGQGTCFTIELPAR